MNLVGSILYLKKVVSWGVTKSLRFGLYVNIAFLVLAISGIFIKTLQLPFPIIAIMCILNIGLSSVIASCNTVAIELAPNHRGLAAAYLGLLRNGVVAGLVLVVGAFFNGTIVPVYIGMAVLTALLTFLIWPHTKDDLSAI